MGATCEANLQVFKLCVIKQVLRPLNAHHITILSCEAVLLSLEFMFGCMFNIYIRSILVFESIGSEQIPCVKNWLDQKATRDSRVQAVICEYSRCTQL